MTSGDEQVTERRTAEHRARSAGPWLFLVLRADELSEAPLRIRLSGFDELRIARADRREVEVHDGEGGRTLRLHLADGWMSRRHARLLHVLGEWLVEDEGSTNGTWLAGAPARGTPLHDGDLLEIGHAFFLFRDARRLEADGEPEREELHPGAGETLLPELAAELRRLDAVSRSMLPVLLTGETGTGKERVARRVHAASGRKGAFQAVNCGALPETLIASELFGYRKGAFSGAVEDRVGLIRASSGGTLFLDEVGDLPASGQAALLRVLQDSEVQPVGATKPVPVDLRVISATHRELSTQVQTDAFRADLFARLNGYAFRLPPLRERLVDLGLLVQALLAKVSANRAPPPSLSIEAARALFRHRWPLNIRELEKALHAALLLAGEGRIELHHLPAGVRDPSSAPPPSHARPVPPRRLLSETELRHRGELEHLLEVAHGNVAETARRAGKGRTQIQRWIQRYGIDVSQYRR